MSYTLTPQTDETKDATPVTLAEPSRVLPKDTNTALREVTKTINTLSKVYVEEIDALTNVDTQEFRNLQEKKLIAARKYQNDMGQMLARKDEVKAADPAMKEKLRKMQEEFSQISQRNLEALKRMQRCTERFGNTLRNAAIRAAQKDRGYSYSENGAISNTAKRKAVSSAISETV